MFAQAILMSCLMTMPPAREPLTDVQRRRIAGLAQLSPPPADPTNQFSNNQVAARLGQRLFFDERMSRNGEISCATCHVPELGFADGLPLPMGLAEGERHTPSLLNVGWHRWFFWDGRADTLWSQALHPFEKDAEFGTTRMKVIHHVAEDPILRREYEAVFGPLPPLEDETRFPRSAQPSGDPKHPDTLAWQNMTAEDQQLVNRIFANIGKAIAAYEHQLNTTNSPFDDFASAMLANDERAMAEYDSDAYEGMLLFIGEAGCRQCHNGPMFSDLEFHNIGIPPGHGGLPQDAGRWEGIDVLQKNPFRANGPFSDSPESQRGRSTASLIRSSEHWGAFRTPSLRNLNRTAPFMHQGQFATLKDVLAFYNTLDDMVVLDHHQETVLQPLDLDERQLAQLETFLLSLSSPEIPRSLREAPKTPELEQKTPLTDPNR